VNLVGGGGAVVAQVQQVTILGAIFGGNTPRNSGSAPGVSTVIFAQNTSVRLYNCYVANESTATRFVQLFDRSSGLPSVGDTPKLSMPLKGGGANEFVSLLFGDLGTLFQNGLQVVVSSDFLTYDDAAVVPSNHGIFCSYSTVNNP
jgi:hypothetical protein